MGDLGWATLTLDGFVAQVRGFRAGLRGEDTYLRARAMLAGRDWAADADGAAADIVWFVNRWAGRLPVAPATAGIAAWLRTHAAELEAMRAYDVLDPRAAGDGELYTRLYDGLLALRRAGVPNMSDAAASKALHQVQPELFVMWDRTVTPFAPGYAAFMGEMHRVALGLRDQAPPGARGDLGAHVSGLLGLTERMSLAKLLDEYNLQAATSAPPTPPSRRGAR